MGALGGVLEMVVVVAIIGGGFIFVTKYLPSILQNVQAAPAAGPAVAGQALNCPGTCNCIAVNGNCVCEGNSNCPCSPCNTPSTPAKASTPKPSKRITTINKLVGYTGPTFPSGQPKCLVGDTVCAARSGLARAFTAHALNRISNKSHG